MSENEKKDEAIAEELTLEPREPGKSTEAAFEKSMGLSADSEIAQLASSPDKPTLTKEQLLDVLKMGGASAKLTKLRRQLKKAIKQDRKSSRPAWRR